MARSLQPKRVSLRDSFASLNHIPRFFSEIRSVNPALFYSNVFARLISAVLPLLMLWVGKLIIDEIILQISLEEKDLNDLWIYTASEFGLAILSDLLSRWIVYSDSLLGDQYSISSSVKIIRKTSTVSLSLLEDADFYDKLERARQQTTGRVALMSNVLTQAQDTFVIISLLIGIVSFEPWLIVLLIISVVPTILNEIKFSGTSYSLARSWTQERRELDYLRYAGASDVTAKEVKLFGLAEYLANRFEELSNKYYKISSNLAGQRARWGSFFNSIGTAAYYGAYVLIILRTVAGIFTIGELTFLSGSFSRLRGRMQGFFTRFTSITERALYLKDYYEFIDIEVPSMSKGGSPLPEKIVTGFKFEDVGFRYPGSEEWVLRNVSFELKAGEKLAFVGENGAGKTTLIKLLLRFYEPTEGKILLDGQDVNEFDLEEYRAWFGVIFQDFVRFELSLKENIAVGEIDEIDNRPRLEEAASRSLADEVVRQMPDGYEQRLGKRFKDGRELSGGQWQKVAIARAYMKEARIMVLDEPTSALDAKAESEAFARFINLTKGKTAVIISHRFSTVRIADRILVLKGGTVLEIGTHEELMENKNLYSELFELQAAGYR